MDEATAQKSFSENTRTVVLIVFSVICWGIIWNVFWHLSWKIINLSPDSLLVNLSLIFNAPSEKREILKEAFRRGLYADFYWLHIFILITNFISAPLIIGFYIERHSTTNKYLNCFLTVFFVTLLRPTLNLFPEFNIKTFLFIIIFKGYFIAPFLFFLTSLGAFIGSFIRSHNDKGLYLTIYSDILNKRKKGVIFLIFAIAFFALSIRGLEKEVEDILSPYYRYAYAPVTFNKHQKDYSLLSIAIPTKDDMLNWPKLTYLNKGDNLALIIYFNNNSYMYRAVNTKLILRKSDAHHFTASLWADNAKPIHQSIEIPHNCNNPVFSYAGSNWYSIHKKESLPIPSGQTGQEILSSMGINLGDIGGIWSGTGWFVTKLKYECSD